jgi:hypothetical protein
VRVAEHLDLDVARLLDELLDEDAVVAEARLGLAAARREALFGLGVVEGDCASPLPPPPADALIITG